MAAKYTVGQIQKLAKQDLLKLLEELGLDGENYKDWQTLVDDINEEVALRMPDPLAGLPEIEPEPALRLRERAPEVKKPAVNTAWRDQLDQFVGTLPVFLRVPAQAAMSRISPEEAAKALKWAMAVYVVSLLLDLDTDSPDGGESEKAEKPEKKIVELGEPEAVKKDLSYWLNKLDNLTGA